MKTTMISQITMKLKEHQLDFAQGLKTHINLKTSVYLCNMMLYCKGNAWEKTCRRSKLGT